MTISQKEIQKFESLLLQTKGDTDMLVTSRTKKTTDKTRKNTEDTEFVYSSKLNGKAKLIIEIIKGWKYSKVKNSNNVVPVIELYKPSEYEFKDHSSTMTTSEYRVCPNSDVIWSQI